ncbi:MAG: 30S ribosomal protein S27ae [Sulfolobales archaeon]|nr:30S ribosomal protein S27ae [Sulfolobales archaeon]MDW8082835.1 30S ribosomal protein S27ae [Sulfolobales archaeon]
MSEKSKSFRSNLYEIDLKKGAIRLKNRVCPKCGRVMALHEKPIPRWHCGYCSYVEVVRS